MSREISLIVDELVAAARDQSVSIDAVVDMVLDASMELEYGNED